MYCWMHHVVLAGTRWLKEASVWLETSLDLHSWSAANNNKAGTKFITQAFFLKIVHRHWDTVGYTGEKLGYAGIHGKNVWDSQDTRKSFFGMRTR